MGCAVGDLAVRVMFHGEVVEHKVLPVKSAVTLGDWPGARVAFPGTAFQVWRKGRQLRVRGRGGAFPALGSGQLYSDRAYG